MKLSKGNIITIGIVGVIAILYFGYDYLEMRNAEQLLRQRYGKEFVASHCEYYMRGPNYYAGIRTYITSKDEPPVKFHVQRLLRKNRNELDVSEGYLSLIWAREVDAKLQSIAENVFGYPVYIGTSISPGSKSNQIQGQTPSYFEALRTHPNIFMSPDSHAAIFVVSFYEMNLSNKQQETERIFRFMGELSKLGIQLNYFLIISYYAPSDLLEAKKRIDFEGTFCIVITKSPWHRI